MGREKTVDQKAVVRSAFSKHASDGVLEFKHLPKVLKDLQMGVSTRELCSLQGHLREMGKDNNDPYARDRGSDETTDFELFFKWFINETQPSSYSSTNALLVRRVIGCSKMPTRNLPKGAFKFGNAPEEKAESAGEVVLNWVSGERSESKEMGVSLQKVNKAAVAAGQITAKQFNTYLKEHREDPRLQRPRPQAQGDKVRKKSNDIKYNDDPRNKNRVGINDILFHQSASDMVEKPYADTSGQTKKGQLPKPRPTRNSDLLRKCTQGAAEQKREEESAVPFKLSKFEKRAVAKVDTGKGRR